MIHDANAHGKVTTPINEAHNFQVFHWKQHVFDYTSLG